MDDFKRGLQEMVQGNSRAALATIVGVKGSTPRKPGAKMIVFADGRTFGTVGGGCGEAEIRQHALSLLNGIQDKKRYTLDMTNDTAEEEGMVCGGTMEVFIDCLEAAQTEFWEEYLQSLESQENFLQLTIVSAEDRSLLGTKMLLKQSGQKIGDLGPVILDEALAELLDEAWNENKPRLLSLNSEGQLSYAPNDSVYHVFVEKVTTPFELLILGGGHIALPLCLMGNMLGYKVTVVDDRPSFANSQRFPEAAQVLCNDFVKALREIKITPATFVIIVTRGHKHDKNCLREVVAQPAGYIGMIGSRRRVKALMGELAEEGIATELLDKVYSPIGLKISAETPQEIAVSIMAEIIQVQRSNKV